MPTYHYRCAACGGFDLLRAVARRDDPARCPTCGSTGSRVVTSAHFARATPSLDRAATAAGRSAESPGVTAQVPPALGAGHTPQRAPGYPPLPRP